MHSAREYRKLSLLSSPLLEQILLLLFHADYHYYLRWLLSFIDFHYFHFRCLQTLDITSLFSFHYFWLPYYFPPLFLFHYHYSSSCRHFISVHYFLRRHTFFLRYFFVHYCRRFLYWCCCHLSNAACRPSSSSFQEAFFFFLSSSAFFFSSLIECEVSAVAYYFRHYYDIISFILRYCFRFTSLRHYFLSHYFSSSLLRHFFFFIFTWCHYYIIFIFFFHFIIIFHYWLLRWLLFTIYLFFVSFSSFSTLGRLCSSSSSLFQIEDMFQHRLQHNPNWHEWISQRMNKTAIYESMKGQDTHPWFHIIEVCPDNTYPDAA